MDQGIPYGRQHISEDDIQAVVKALRSEFLTQGPKIGEFEDKFAAFTGCKYAVAVSNGTAALHLAALALGVNDTSRVITTPITFAASANCILYCGGAVEFGDIDPATGTLDIERVREMVSSKPKGYYQGIIPVDLAGYPVNLEEFRSLADEFGLWIIEDACHSPGGYFIDSRNEKQKCGNGSYAEIGVFSFHPVKHIATGEGGMITTNNKKIYEKLLKLRTHGITKNPRLLEKNDFGWYYEMQELGYNYRIPDILCALGLSQLGRLEENLESRKAIARKYDESFASIPFIHPLTSFEALVKAGVSHAYHLYVIRTTERSKLYNFLKKRNIFTQVHYIPVYQMPYYRNLGYENVKCERAEEYYNQCLSLPMYPTLTEREQSFVIDSIIKFTKDL